MQKYHSKKAKLTEKGLQKLDDEIKSDQHLRLVAEKLNKWEKKADLLDLLQRDVSDLKDQYGGNPSNYRLATIIMHQMSLSTITAGLKPFWNGKTMLWNHPTTAFYVFA